MTPKTVSGRHRLALVSLLAGVCAAALLAPTAGAARAVAAPKLASPTATGRTLVNRFFSLLQHKDTAGLRAFLSPAFQVQRADGTGAGKEAYLAKLAVVLKFKLANVTATQAGGTLVVRYDATVEGTVNGKPYTPGPAPRLSTFAWSGTAWQLAAHANFNPLTG